MSGSLLTLAQTLGALSPIGGRVLNPDFCEGDFFFSSVATDSRNVAENSLFVPLVGERQDGHNFIPQAVGRGCSAVFVSRDDAFVLDLARSNPKVAFIYSENTMTALQRAAAAYVGKFPGLIRCAVTGSSGKTTTKELCRAVLSQRFSVVATEGNLNSETGLPLSVFGIREGHELGIFEMGMNREGEIGEIASVFRPNFAIVTNIGSAHIGRLGSRGNIAREKRKIFSYIDGDGAAFVPDGGEFSDFLCEGVRGKVVRYGISSDPRVRFLSDDGLSGTFFSVDGTEVRLKLPGRHNFLDALAAVSLALELGLSADEIKAGIESVGILDGRSQVLRGKYTVLKDCYNANPDSMSRAIEFCSGIEVPGKKIFVLGDMLELGADSAAEHRKIGEMLSESDADMAVLVGDEIDEAVLGCGRPRNGGKGLLIVSVRGRGEDAVSLAADAINTHAREGDFILLKGSRGVGLERILPLIGM